MSLGYDKPLYLLPFDHRYSFVAGLFNFKPPLPASQRDQVIATNEQLARTDGDKDAFDQQMRPALMQ